MATSSAHSSLYDAGIEKPPLSTSLTALGDRLKTQPVDEALICMANLAPDVEATTTSLGVLSLLHPAYSGTTSLDDLARTYLDIGRKISNSEDASLPTRLRWADLHKYFEKWYERANASARRDCLKTFLMCVRHTRLGCACCVGEPWAVIPFGMRDNTAFLFTEDEFRRLWPTGKSTGGLYGQGYKRVAASRKMVEEAMFREKGRVVSATSSSETDEWTIVDGLSESRQEHALSGEPGDSLVRGI